MYTIRYTLAALLLTTQWAMAEPMKDEQPEHRSNNARKAIVMLAAMGVDHPEVVHFVQAVDANVDDGYLLLAEKEALGGKFTLHYELSGGVTAKQAELKFTPQDSNMEYTARTNAVMVNYSYKF